MATEAPAVTSSVSTTPEGFTKISSSNGWETISNSVTPEKAEANLKEQGTDEKSKAASTLGKAGAEARKIKPIPPKPKMDAKPEEKPADVEEAEDEPEVEAKGDEKTEQAKAEGDPRKEATAKVALATRQAREAREEAAELRRQLESIRHGETHKEYVAKQGQPKAEPEFDWRKEPDEKEYEAAGKTYGEFLKDTVDHRMAMKAQEDYEASQQHQRAATIHKSIETKVEAFKSKVSEQFEGIAENEVSDLIGHCSFALPPGAPPSPINVVADTLVLHCDNPGRIEQFFRTDDGKQELQRIATLRTPTEIQLALAKLDYRLGVAATTGTPAAKKEKSKAKEPFEPVSGSPGTIDTLEMKGDENLDQYLAKKKALARRQ